MKWFRFYSEALDDPKVQRLPGELFKVWVNLLCLANRSESRGVLPPLADIAFSLRLSEPAAAAAVAELEARGLLDAGTDGPEPHNWSSRQPDSDTPQAAAERKRRQRRRQRQSRKSHSDSHAEVTPQSRGEGEETREEQTDSLAQGREARAGGPARGESACASNDEPPPADPVPERQPSPDVPALVAEMEADLAAVAERAGQKPGRKSLMIVQGEDRTAWADQTGAPVPWPDRPRLLRLALARVEDRESDSLRGALRYVVLQQYDPAERTTAAALAERRAPPPGAPDAPRGPLAGLEQWEAERAAREAEAAAEAEQRAAEDLRIAAWEAEDQVRSARWKREETEAAEQNPVLTREWVEKVAAAGYRLRVLAALDRGDADAA